MDLAVSLVTAGDAGNDLRSLRDWLRSDDDFTGTADLAMSAPALGEMGAVSDALNVAVGPGELVAVVSAVSVWLRTRRSDVKVRLKHGDRETEVNVTNADDVAALVRLARELQSD